MKLKLESATWDKVKKVYRIIIFLMALWGVYVTRQNYVLRCSEGGMLMTQTKCDEFAKSHFYEAEYNRLQMVNNNPDLFSSKETSND